MRTKKERLCRLYDLILQTPTDIINMDTWRDAENRTDLSDEDLAAAVKQVVKTKTSCGTTACALGFACSSPDFIKEGLSWKIDGTYGGFFPSYNKDGETYTGFAAAAEFFNISDDRAELIFGTVGGHENGTDKEIFLRRLRKYLLKKAYITKSESYRLRWLEELENEAEAETTTDSSK